MDNQKNWFERHKILTGIIVFLFFVAFIGNTSETRTKITVTTDTPQITAHSTNELVLQDFSKESCNSIVVGMTAQEVSDRMGEPKSSSESDLGELGKSSYWHYQEGFSLDACGVMIMDGKVSAVTWSSL